MFSCLRCGIKCSKKSNLNRHLRKKVECDAKYLDLPRNIVITHYKDHYALFKSILDNQNENSISSLSQIDSEPAPDKNEGADDQLQCQHCNKKFKFKSNLCRHVKSTCKVMIAKKKSDDLYNQYLQTNYDKLVIEHENKLKEDIKEELAEEFQEKINKEIAAKNEIKVELEKKIKDLEEKLSKQIIKKQKVSQINNGTINNGNINNITIINNFGEEDLSGITIKEWEEIMGCDFDMIIKFIEKVHLLTPENRSIFIASLKEKYAMVMKNQKMQLVEKNNFIRNLMNNSNIMLEDMLNKFGNQFETIDAKRSQSIITYCGTDDEERKKIQTDITLLLFNNRELVKKTYEQVYGQKIGTR